MPFSTSRANSANLIDFFSLCRFQCVHFVWLLRTNFRWMNFYWFICLFVQPLPFVREYVINTSVAYMQSDHKILLAKTIGFIWNNGKWFKNQKKTTNTDQMSKLCLKWQFIIIINQTKTPEKNQQFQNNITKFGIINYYYGMHMEVCMGKNEAIFHSPFVSFKHFYHFFFEIYSKCNNFLPIENRLYIVRVHICAAYRQKWNGMKKTQNRFEWNVNIEFYA